MIDRKITIGSRMWFRIMFISEKMKTLEPHRALFCKGHKRNWQDQSGRLCIQWTQRKHKPGVRLFLQYLAGANSYLVRPSGTQTDSYALMLNVGQRIEKFLIKSTDDEKFELGSRRFSSINDIVERYKQTDICEGSFIKSRLNRGGGPPPPIRMYATVFNQELGAVSVFATCKWRSVTWE